jgi:type I restriction enzyme R subunit
VSNLNRNESLTRTELIDIQLARAGWSKNRRTLVEEVLLQTADPSGAYGNDQFADYVLLGSDQIPLAVVEAKRSSRDELAGKRQAADYADVINARFGVDPFIFLTNGKEIQFWIVTAIRREISRGFILAATWKD